MKTNSKSKRSIRALTSAIGKKTCLKSKRSQEEMIGFALIIIIVAVILLIFLGFSIRRQQKEAVESYEVESFIQAFLQYTSDCSDGLEYLSIQKLIFSCGNGESCVNEEESICDTESCAYERKTCDVLEDTLKNIIEKSWKIDEETPVKGYELKISSDEESLLMFQEGNNATNNYKGAVQFFSRRGIDYEITFRAYY